MEPKTQPAKRWLVPALVAVIAVLIIALFAMRSCAPAETVSIQDGDVPKIGYAEGVTVVADPEALQKAVDEMYAKATEGNIMLEYANDAASTDGETFSCYIANAVENSYDMYIQMFADSALTDQLLLSGLLRPGTAFESITLEHSLDPGTHRVYVAFTQVEEDLATIHGQVMVTMDLTVTD